MALSKVLATVISVIILLVLDAGYIYTIKNGYLNMVQNIQGGRSVKLSIYGAVMSYIFVVAGLAFYVLPYADKMMKVYEDGTSIMTKLYIAVTVGAFFGLIVYGVYNTTNMALFKEFSLQFALFDIVWGAFLYYISTFVYLLLRS
jgi:uncharacterized membrane protein